MTPRSPFLPLLLALAVAAAGARAAEPPPGAVALTFDDLPGLTLRDDPAAWTRINARLLRSLRRHRFPAVGFVIADRLEGAERRSSLAVLDRWLDAGMELGNHTYSHESPNALGAEAYVADVARADALLRPILARRGRTPRWFRHPYLETGAPIAAKRRIEAGLSALGYATAPVTIDADDWEFAEPYDDAVQRGDGAAAARIRGSYLRYTERTIAWCQEASEALFGRRIAFVMLLHATRLNADAFEGLARIFGRRRLTPVRLETAMADPAYARPDRYAGADGVDWLERWSLDLGRELPWSDWRDPPPAIVRAYDALNGDRR